MMTIKNIRIENHEKRTKLLAYIQLNSEAVKNWKIKSARIDPQIAEGYQDNFLDENYGFDMWFDVPKEYGYSLCDERADAFLVACLYYAMVSGESIRCELPVTDKLLYQINEYLIPILCRESEGYKKITIYAEPAPEVEHINNFIGTGISCGVDSFSTVLLHIKEDIPKNFRLTHLTLFNTGALNFYGYSKNKSLEQWRKETMVELSERIRLGRKVADELSLGFIDIDTNIPEMYQGGFSMSHTFRNCSSVLASQKMWNYYYYSSAGEGAENMTGLKYDCAHYDMLNIPNISLNKLQFFSGGLAYTRMEKLEIISDNPVVQKNINVCSYTHNCGRCCKCIRTLLALDIIGKVDFYKDSFEDILYYKKNRWKFMGAVMESKPKDFFNYDMKLYMQRNNLKFSTKTKMYHFLKPLRAFRLYLLKNIEYFQKRG